MNDLVFSPKKPPEPFSRSRLGDLPEESSRPLRILVLTGLKEELEGILKSGFTFDRETRLYQSVHVPGLFAGTTGPGLTKRKELRKAIQRVLPDVVVNGGLVGSLLEESGTGQRHKTGDRLRLGEIIDGRDSTVYPGGRGRDRLVTVDRPVFEPLAKMNLHLEHRAVACDMEAARLLELLGKLRDSLPELVVVFCKVVGDLPEDYFLFQLEEQIRGWGRRSRWERLGVFLRYPGNALRLRRLFGLKRTALDSLTGRMGGLVRRIYREGRVAEDMDSVFIPH